MRTDEDELERLRGINAELVETANHWLLLTARQEDEIKRLRDEIDRLQADLWTWQSEWGNI